MKLIEAVINRFKLEEVRSVLDEIGVEGQRRLAAAHVLVIGAGGLGSPAALYLAAAGVGTLGIADLDRVEEHNLQRQLLHDTASIGAAKVTSAAHRLHVHVYSAIPLSEEFQARLRTRLVAD